MKKILIPLIFISLFISFCGKKSETVKLKKGSEAYQFAKEISNKLPFLDPDSNKVLVKTSDFIITTGEVLKSIYDNSAKQADRLKQLPADRIKMGILQTAQKIGERKLVMTEAGKVNFKVPKPVLDSLVDLQYSHAGGEEKFLEMLQNSGANIEAIKKDIREYMIFDRYLEETLGNRIQVSDEEIQKAYDDYASKEIATVRHILLMTQGKNPAEKQEIRKKMEDILARARNGEDFAELAKEYTEDPGSKQNGGLYENFPKGQMVKPFEDAAFTVPVGEISDIVETRYGYHILKIVARNNYKSLEEYRPELEGKLKSQKKPQAFRDYIKNLKEKLEYEEVTF